MGTFTRTPGTLAANQMVKDALPKDVQLTPRAEAAMNELLQARIDGKPLDAVNLSLGSMDPKDLQSLEAAVRHSRQQTMEVSLSPSSDSREKAEAQGARREWDNALANVQTQQMTNERNGNSAGRDADLFKKAPEERESIAVELTEEQTKLLLSAEYPNDGASQKTALNNIYDGADKVSVMNESVLLDYSHDQKTFFAELERDEKPALDAKLTQLQADRERDQQKQVQDPRQRERNAEHSR